MSPTSDHQSDSEPSPDMVEAWLAGELTEEQNEAVERNFAEQPDSTLDDDEFRELDTEAPSAEVDKLVAQILTDGELVPPDAEDWRSILEPCDDPALLGTLGKSPRYEVNSVIAVGGMSIVFKGRDPALDRTVALKALTPGLAANHLTRERFLREVRVAAKLDHENILPIHGVHDDASVPFFAMKFVDGGTLQDALDDRSIPFEQLRPIARQVASALATAHAAGVIHRDIKPANILLDADGQRAWLCDFGIARSTEDPSLTYAGSIAGTPHYMAPEQATGGEVDHRSDLFSLGAVLYQCATGSPPFPGQTSTAVIQSVTSFRPAPARRANPSLPKWFEGLLERLLAKPPGDRPETANDVVRCIDTASAPKARGSWKRPLIFAALALLLAGLAFMFISPPAVGPHPLLVTTTSDEDDGSADPKLGTGTSLREAVAYRTVGVTIGFDRSLSGTTLTISSTAISVDDDITIDATDLDERPVLDAGGQARHFHVTGDLTLRNLTLTNGKSEGEGGSIFGEHGRLTLEGCHFTKNQAKSGGAITVMNGTAALTGCHFAFNNGGNNGGALRIIGSLASVDDCRFVENTAFVGAGIRGREGSSVTVHNCDFERNTARGAVAVAAYDGSMSISDSRFTGNVATESTGAVYASTSAKLSVTDSIFTDNIAITTAGAIFSNGHTLELHDCQFQNNTAASGGAVHISRGDKLDVCRNTFLNNSSPQLLIDHTLDATDITDNEITPPESTFKDALKRLLPRP